MKRLLVVFAVLCPLCLFVAGCDGGSSHSKGSQPTAEEMKQKQEDVQKKMAEMKMGKKGGGAPVDAGKK